MCLALHPKGLIQLAGRCQRRQTAVGDVLGTVTEDQLCACCKGSNVRKLFPAVMLLDLKVWRISLQHTAPADAQLIKLEDRPHLLPEKALERALSAFLPQLLRNLPMNQKLN